NSRPPAFDARARRPGRPPPPGSGPVRAPGHGPGARGSVQKPPPRAPGLRARHARDFARAGQAQAPSGPPDRVAGQITGRPAVFRAFWVDALPGSRQGSGHGRQSHPPSQAPEVTVSIMGTRVARTEDPKLLTVGG